MGGMCGVGGDLGLFALAVSAAHANDASYEAHLGRWLDALQAGAPGAVVQPLLTHADRLLPAHARDDGAVVAHQLARTSQMCTFGAPRALATTGKVMYELTLESVGAAVLVGHADGRLSRRAPPRKPCAPSGILLSSARACGGCRI